jgi:hypothetical protein
MDRAVFTAKRFNDGALFVEDAMDIYTPEQLAEIRRLNDNFRFTFRGGQLVCTPSVLAMPTMVIAAAFLKVSEFDDFNARNDPFGEHDCLSFELCNRTFFFKIDYYNLNMEFGSPDPSDPSVTQRVGVLMLASDW